MKKQLLTLALLWAAIQMAAVPARRVEQQITLADGQTVQVQLVGDEFGHWYVDREGNAYMLQDGIGRRLPAEEVTRKKQKANRLRSIQQEPQAPTINLAPRGLVILAEFQDVHFWPGNTQAAMDSMLNGQHYDYDISIGSARQYFSEQSNGLYTPQFDVVGPVRLPEKMAYYGRNNADGNDTLVGDMVLHACALAHQLPEVNFRNYDNDGDEWVDFVYIIYAGYGEADGASANTMWPASFNIPSAIYLGYTSLPQSSWGDYEQYWFDSVAIGNFAYSSELNYYNSVLVPTRGFESYNPMRNGISTFCHEFSHVLGLPDYYDTKYGYNDSHGLTPGAWSLMDAGAHSADGAIPPAYSVYDRYFLGWSTPSLLNSSQDVTLTTFSQGGATTTSLQDGYYITATGDSALAWSPEEVYYIENRQQTGWDISLPGSGMLVWKVEYDSYLWESNILNNTKNDCHLQIIPADGRYSYSGGDAGDTFPGSKNVTQWSPFPNQLLTGITEDAAGVVNFHYEKSEATSLASVETGNKATKTLEEGRIVITRDGQQFDILGTQIK